MIKRFNPDRAPQEDLVRLQKANNHIRFAYVGGAAVIIFVAFVSIATLAFRHHTQSPAQIDQETIKQINGFKPYYFKSGFQTDYKLKSETVQYSNGVLVFQIQNPDGKTIAFTEEATPSGYDISMLKADKKYTNGYGQVFITDAAFRTTGALFTDDKTWILVNSPQAVGAELIEQVLNALQPVSR